LSIGLPRKAPEKRKISMETKPYHLRRKDKAIKSKTEILEIVKSQKLLTIAMCKDDEPYLITADYGYDEKNNCFFIHCAKRGKKIDHLNANPKVWGTIIEDRGYTQGECEHSYLSVHFEGKARLITDLDKKRRALELMIDFLEEDPEKGKREFITKTKFLNVLIIRIDVLRFTGKSSAIRTKK